MCSHLRFSSMSQWEMWSWATGRDRCTASHLTCAVKIKAIEFRMLMTIHSEKQKKNYRDHPLTSRSSCLHSSKLALKTPENCQTERNFQFCISAWSWLCLCGCFKKTKQQQKKKTKDSLLTTVAKSSAQKEKKKGRNTTRKKWFIALKEEKKHNINPALVPSFPKAHCSAMRFLKSPTCALHMLLPRANETKTVLCFTILETRGCVSIK